MRKDVIVHERNCKTNVAICQFCKDSFDAEAFKKHQNKCGEMPMECDLLCGERMKRKELHFHKVRTCPNLKVPCHHCNDIVLKKNAEDHTQKKHKKVVAEPQPQRYQSVSIYASPQLEQKILSRSSDIKMEVKNMTELMNAIQSGASHLEFSQYFDWLTKSVNDSRVLEARNEARTNISTIKYLKNEVTKEGVNALSGFLSQLYALSQLEIGFIFSPQTGKNEQTTSKEWANLFSSISNLSHITQLKLKFSGLQRRLSSADIAFTNLCEMIDSLQNLNQLKLLVMGFRGISDADLNKLCYSLSSLQNLSQLELDFSECLGITDKSVLKLCDTLGRLLYLVKLELRLPFTKQEVKEAAKNLLSKIPDLRVK